MAHEVIMPALGMAQDSGLIVSWLKAPGDRVVAGDALFEVETDKATVEVEAQAEGFLSAVTAAAGEEVPVGQVIARIVAAEAEVDAAATAEATTAVVAPAAERQPSATVASKAPGHAASALGAAAEPHVRRPASPRAPGRPAVPVGVLASPKARRLAAEQGLDLSRLVAAGHSQPYHVADLALFPTLGTVQRSVLTARADAGMLDALLVKAAPETGRARLFAAFAAGAWRAVFKSEGPALTLLSPDGSRENIAPAEGARPLTLADLTETRLTGYVPEEPGFTLAIARDGSSLALTLSFGAAELAFGSAAAFLDELAARIEDPVRQLV